MLHDLFHVKSNKVDFMGVENRMVVTTTSRYPFNTQNFNVVLLSVKNKFNFKKEHQSLFMPFPF